MKTRVKAGQGRVAQRRRTRKHIVDATIRLLLAGHTPTLDDVVKAADVSRRTVYMYFPTFEQLLLDATVGALSATTVDPAVEAAQSGHDPAERVERLARAVSRHSAAMLHLGRALIRLTIEANGRAGAEPRRGYRRVEWIERTLAPARDRLGPASFERLVSALSVVIGWEAEIVLRDVRGLKQTEVEEVVAWTARTLVESALSDARRKTQTRTTRRR